jgi:hypothetical protein
MLVSLNNFVTPVLNNTELASIKIMVTLMLIIILFIILMMFIFQLSKEDNSNFMLPFPIAFTWSINLIFNY